MSISSAFRGVVFKLSSVDPVLSVRVYTEAFHYISRCISKSESRISPVEFIRDEIILYFGGSGVKQERRRRTPVDKVWTCGPDGYYQFSVRIPMEVYNTMVGISEAHAVSMSELTYRILTARAKQNPYNETVKLSQWRMAKEDKNAPGRRPKAVSCPHCGKFMDKHGKPIRYDYITDL